MALTASDLRQWFRRFEPYVPMAAIALVAFTIAWGFSYVTLRHTASMGLPLDDSYIYLTYAKQFGRFQPFTYYPGGGYSAGATSILWPIVLAPFWMLGARGHALVWVAFLLCSVLYAAVAVAAYRFVRDLCGQVTGMIAAALVLACAPFAWCSLSGMDVALAVALFLGSLLLLARHAPGRPRRLLLGCLAACGLSRPELLVIVIAICGAGSVRQLFVRDVRGGAWWLLPLAPPAMWMVLNRIFAGNFFPNTSHVKSHLFLPGFTWDHWWAVFKALIKTVRRGLYWTVDTPAPVPGKLPPPAPVMPLVWPRFVLVLQLVGSVRVLLWARRERRWLAGVTLVVSPIALLLIVIATSGQWTFQNFRYIAPVFPLIAIIAACGLAPPRWWPGPLEFVAPILKRLWLAIACVVVALYARAAWPQLRSDMQMYAQAVSDTNTQVVRIGHYLRDKAPDARVMLHDAGAIAYYGDTWVYDMFGLVTNHQADVTNNGPGARFEFLESLPPDERPTHFAYYPGWMGSNEWFGATVVATPLYAGFDRRRIVGEGDMELIVANWDHAHTAERPLNAREGWRMVDRVDVADLASEREHAWHGLMGPRRFQEQGARWSFVEREVGDSGLAIDGGRTIRGGSEQLTVMLDPAKPTRVVIRTGGLTEYPFHEAIKAPITLELLSGYRVLGTLTVPPPAGRFSELTFNLPPHALPSSPAVLRTRASGIYRVFHWFVLQPD
jgi:hypothetical protein